MKRGKQDCILKNALFAFLIWPDCTMIKLYGIMTQFLDGLKLWNKELITHIKLQQQEVIVCNFILQIYNGFNQITIMSLVSQTAKANVPK